MRTIDQILDSEAARIDALPKEERAEELMRISQLTKDAHYIAESILRIPDDVDESITEELIKDLMDEMSDLQIAIVHEKLGSLEKGIGATATKAGKKALGFAAMALLAPTIGGAKVGAVLGRKIAEKIGNAGLSRHRATRLIDGVNAKYDSPYWIRARGNKMIDNMVGAKKITPERGRAMKAELRSKMIDRQTQFETEKIKAKGAKRGGLAGLYVGSIPLGAAVAASTGAFKDPYKDFNEREMSAELYGFSDEAKAKGIQAFNATMKEFEEGKLLAPGGKKITSRKLATQYAAMFADEAAMDWDESEHPRDERGRFTHKADEPTNLLKFDSEEDLKKFLDGLTDAEREEFLVIANRELQKAKMSTVLGIGGALLGTAVLPVVGTAVGGYAGYKWGESIDKKNEEAKSAPTPKDMGDRLREGNGGRKISKEDQEWFDEVIRKNPPHPNLGRGRHKKADIDSAVVRKEIENYNPKRAKAAGIYVSKDSFDKFDDDDKDDLIREIMVREAEGSSTWNEADHPRDEDGRFTNKGVEVSDLGNHGETTMEKAFTQEDIDVLIDDIFSDEELSKQYDGLSDQEKVVFGMHMTMLVQDLSKLTPEEADILEKALSGDELRKGDYENSSGAKRVAANLVGYAGFATGGALGASAGFAASGGNFRAAQVGSIAGAYGGWKIGKKVGNWLTGRKKKSAVASERASKLNYDKPDAAGNPNGGLGGGKDGRAGRDADSDKIFNEKEKAREKSAKSGD